MAKRNDGKPTEALVRESLLYLERHYKSTFLRLYDSKSAGYGSGGNLIPEQPSDFLLQMQGCAGCLIECKSSSVHDTLGTVTLRDVFTPYQIAGARLWARAGGKSLVVFQPLPSKMGTIEIWDMQDVITAYLNPPRKRKLLGTPHIVKPIMPLQTVTSRALGEVLMMILCTNTNPLAH